MQTFSYDVVIVGGGIVGATLACALAQQTPLSIAIVEAKSEFPKWSSDHYDYRVSAITLSSQRVFKSLGVWDEIKNKRVSPFAQIEVWEAQQDARIHFDCMEIGEAVLGFIIENNLIQTALFERIKTCPQITWLSPIELTTFEQQENQIVLSAKNNVEIKAKLAVAADGPRSWLRQQASISIDNKNYEQEAIVATVQTELSHREVARQVFLPSGPLAFLPLLDNQMSSIVWSVPTMEAKRLMALSSNEFMQQLEQAFCLGTIKKISERFAFPLFKQAAHEYVRSSVALAGDAAHLIHPLAGQGVNIGILDAASLAEIVSKAIQENRDYASFHNLRRYERWRKADNFILLAGIDILKNLFASDKKSIQTLRSFGLNFTNKTLGIKNLITRFAVGNRDGLPEIARLKY